jgi:hypothetical protein
MTVEPSFFGPWPPVVPGVFTVIGVLLGFGLGQVKEWCARRKRHAAFWQAINAELKFSGGLAASVFAEPRRRGAALPASQIGA